MRLNTILCEYLLVLSINVAQFLLTFVAIFSVVNIVEPYEFSVWTLSIKALSVTALVYWFYDTLLYVIDKRVWGMVNIIALVIAAQYWFGGHLSGYSVYTPVEMVGVSSIPLMLLGFTLRAKHRLSVVKDSVN